MQKNCLSTDKKWKSKKKNGKKKKKRSKWYLGENLIICLLLSIKKNNDNIYMNIIFIHSTIPKEEIKMKKKQN